MTGKRLVLALVIAVCFCAPSMRAEAGQRWALLVGVNKYTQVDPLKFCDADMQGLHDRLIATGFPDSNVFLLCDGADDPKYLPFKVNIERQLDLVLGTLADKDDLVLVAFSCHGVFLDGGSYLCPTEARLEDPAETMVSLEKLYDRLQKCPAALKLLLVDACRNDPRVDGRKSMRAMEGRKQFAGSLERPPQGILLLNSCAPGEYSMEDPEFGHGVFMHFVLEGLGGQADSDHNGRVSLTELYQYANYETKTFVARKFNDSQRPALRGELTDNFDLALNVSATPRPAEVPSRPQPERPTSMPAEQPVLAPPATGGLRENTANSIGMKFVLIQPGEFTMGYGVPRDEEGNEYKDDDYDAWRHRVRITRPYYLGQFEVTLGQFLTFYHDAVYKTDAEKTGRGEGYVGVQPAAFPDDPFGPRLFGPRSDAAPWHWGFDRQTNDHPVVDASWNDAAAFCQWLSRKEGKTYRLPTEAEWEFACHAGTTKDPDLQSIGNYRDASWDEYRYTDGYRVAAQPRAQRVGSPKPYSDGFALSAPVGSFKPNAWGLYDMLGNAAEWCADWYGKEYYQNSPGDDPPGPASSEKGSRVRRGGSFCTVVSSVERDAEEPSSCRIYSGFRVVLEP